MTIEDFNTNFAVSIVEYNVDDIANTVTINFAITCTSNNRKSIWVSVVDTTTLSEGYTSSDVLDAAWNDVKASVNDWAVYNLAETAFTEYTVASVSDAITLSDFNTNFTVYLGRFDLYPSIQPTSWCIGFRAQRNGKDANIYVDATIPIADHCNNTLCASIADTVWDLVKSRVSSWAATELAKDNVINTTFVPADFTA
jgi:hypothetical protein